MDVILTHSFQSVLATSYVRIVASTGVRWIGHKEKCFRFEILGCSPYEQNGFQPDIYFRSRSLPAGFIESKWDHPSLLISNRERVHLEIAHYLVNVTNDISPDEKTYNVSDRGLIGTNPAWGAKYKFEVVCIHKELELNCGSHNFQALVYSKQACFKHLPNCPLVDHITFVTPTDIEATSKPDGSVFIKWNDTNGGWKSSRMEVRVQDEIGRSISGLAEHANSISIPKLTKNHEYKLIFIPSGQYMPAEVQEYTSTLILRNDSLCMVRLLKKY